MADKPKDSPKRCFVICPIGERGSEIRARSDDLFNSLIEPVARDAGYAALRVIDNDRPGDITTKIIGDIIEADAVICDITGHNPNVFYELAIAHAWKKPCVIISSDDPIRVPFDIGSQNVIQILLGSFGAMAATIDNLKRHLFALGKDSVGQDNPVGRYERGKELRQSGDPMANTVEAMQAEMSELRATIQKLSSSRTPDDTRPPPEPPPYGGGAQLPLPKRPGTQPARARGAGEYDIPAFLKRQAN